MSISQEAEIAAERTRQKLLGGPELARQFRNTVIAKMMADTEYVREYIKELCTKINADKKLIGFAILFEQPTIQFGAKLAHMSITVLNERHPNPILTIFHDGEYFKLQDELMAYPQISTRNGLGLVAFIEIWLVQCQVATGHAAPQ